VKHESLGLTARYWVGQNKQRRYMWKRVGKKLSLTRGRGQDGRIREVLQESSRSSMYKSIQYCNVIHIKEEGNWDVAGCLPNIRLCMIVLPMITYHSALTEFFL
jgi:hypothetical protein